MIAGITTERLWMSIDGGANWTEPRPAGDVNLSYQSVSMNSDGSVIIVCASSGRIYTSQNSGGAWTERRPYGAGTALWRRVFSNAAGDAMFALNYGFRMFGIYLAL
jgi:photosystem II stability/assembly factor-like uncharacterized protein